MRYVIKKHHVTFSQFCACQYEQRQQMETRFVCVCVCGSPVEPRKKVYVCVCEREREVRKCQMDRCLKRPRRCAQTPGFRDFLCELFLSFSIKNLQTNVFSCVI